MKINIHILILILFCQANSLLQDNKRKEFFLKYIEKIPNDRIESIPYDKKEIDNIISRYKFPAS